MVSCTVCGALGKCDCLTFRLNPNVNPFWLPKFRPGPARNEKCRCQECIDPEIIQQISELSSELAETKLFAIDLMHMLWGDQSHVRRWPEWVKKYTEENLDDQQ